MAKILHIPRHSGGPAFVDKQNPANLGRRINAESNAWWLPIHSGGNTLRDIVNGYHMDIQGAMWVNGSNGFPSLSFNGIGDYAEMQNVAGITDIPFTICAWVNDLGGGSNAIITIVDSGRVDLMYGIRTLEATGAAQIIARYFTFYSAEGTTVVQNTGWHFIAGVFVSNTEKILYVDGVNEAILTTPTSWNNDTNTTSIGRFGDLSPGGYFTGEIGPARVFGYAVGPREMMELYQEGRRGYPNYLNRRPITYFIPAAAATRRIFVIS